MSEIALSSNRVPPFTIKVASFFLFLGLATYPFSVAGSNFFFALLLIAALVQFKIIQYGFHICWYQYRHLTVAILLYMLLTIIGILWSHNTHEALRLSSKLIYWLMIPVIIGLYQYAPSQYLKYAYLAVSIGLFLHLILASLQYLQIVTINHPSIGGTSAADPSGYLGHLSFGFIYGIWIGGLLIQASITKSNLKFLYYAVAMYAFVSVFLTQGRSGYLITLALVCLVLWKIYFKNISKLTTLLVITVGLFALGLFFSINTAGKDKLAKTVTEVESYMNGHFEHANIRLKIWSITLDIWQESPFLGIGTGDYREEFDKKVQSPKYEAYKMSNLSYNHSHNGFLFSLVRWGIPGILVFLYLMYAWVSTGLKESWDKQPMSAYLITASGLAVLINSFSDSGLTALTTTIFAVITLALGLSKNSSTL